MDSNKRGLANTEKHSAVLVVSFFGALMINQVKSLRTLGVKCSMVTSSSGGLTNNYKQGGLLRSPPAVSECCKEATTALYLGMGSKTLHIEHAHL